MPVYLKLATYLFWILFLAFLLSLLILILFRFRNDFRFTCRSPATKPASLRPDVRAALRSAGPRRTRRSRTSGETNDPVWSLSGTDGLHLHPSSDGLQVHLHPSFLLLTSLKISSFFKDRFEDLDEDVLFEPGCPHSFDRLCASRDLLCQGGGLLWTKGLLLSEDRVVLSILVQTLTFTTIDEHGTVLERMRRAALWKRGSAHRGHVALRFSPLPRCACARFCASTALATTGMGDV